MKCMKTVLYFYKFLLKMDIFIHKINVFHLFASATRSCPISVCIGRFFPFTKLKIHD